MAASTASALMYPQPDAVDAELLVLLRDELDTEEQSMFLDGFAVYLSCNPRSDFVVDLEDVYEWMGFTRKDNAKAKLIKTLVNEKDYQVLLLRSQEQNIELNRGGHNKERIMMTVHGFKRLCMAAGTEKATRVQQYYLTMEEVVFEYTRRKMAENAQRLVEHERAAAEAARILQDKEHTLQVQATELERFRSKTYEEVPRLDKVYICKEASQLGTDIHKIGKSIDETRREAQLNTGSADGNKMVYNLDVSNGKLVEDIIKHTLKRYHHAREHYNCRIEHTVACYDIAGTVVDTLTSSYEFITRAELFGKVMEQLEAKCGVRPVQAVPTQAPTPPAPTDYVRRFLSAGPEESPHVHIVRQAGAHVSLGAFRLAFSRYMRHEHRGKDRKWDDADLDTLMELGYGVVEANFCRTCDKEARGGPVGVRCCAEYSQANRTHQARIYDMRIVYATDADVTP